jgi:hypothetical protein
MIETPLLQDRTRIALVAIEVKFAGHPDQVDPVGHGQAIIPQGISENGQGETLAHEVESVIANVGLQLGIIPVKGHGVNGPGDVGNNSLECQGHVSMLIQVKEKKEKIRKRRK